MAKTPEEQAAEAKVAEAKLAETRAAEIKATEAKLAELKAAQSPPGPLSLTSAVNAVVGLGWWGTLFRVASLFIIIGLMWFGSSLLSRGDLNQGVSDVGFTRGLITLVLLLFVVGMAATLVLYTINEDISDKIKIRVDSARDVLTPILGIFGTVIGFYFGSFDKTEAPSAEQAAVRALGGVLVGDSAYFLDGTMTDADLAKLAAIHPLRHLNLDRTKVTDEGLRTQLIKLDDLTYLSLRETKVTPGAVNALKTFFTERKKTLTVEFSTIMEPRSPPLDQSGKPPDVIILRAELDETFLLRTFVVHL